MRSSSESWWCFESPPALSDANFRCQRMEMSALGSGVLERQPFDASAVWPAKPLHASP